MAEKLVETVTVEREVTGPLRDLVLFAKHLYKENIITPSDGDDFSNEVLLREAKVFWEREHGDEHG